MINCRLWVELYILVKGSLITTFPMTDHSLWVNIAYFMKGSLIIFVLWPPGSEWDTFWEMSSHIFSYGQQGVSHITHFLNASLIRSFPITNREWVILHIFVKGNLITSFPVTHRLWAALHFFLDLMQSHYILSCDQQLVSNIEHLLCERQSHHILSCDQQGVSDITWTQFHHIFSPMTNRKWVTFTF